MAMSPQELIDMLRREFPRGVQGKDFEQQALHAVENGLPYGGARFRERIDLDIWGNGVRQRFELPGRGVRLLDENDWVTPVNMNDTLYDQPTVAGGYAANLSGNLAPGTYLATYSWTFPIRDTTGAVTGYADTPPAPIASVTIPGTANGGIVRSALTGLNPSGAYVTDWISSTPNSGELRMAGRQSAMTSTTIANLPTATASLAPVDYTDLASLGYGWVEGGIDDSGNPDPTVSTLVLENVPDPGMRMRVSYTRTPRMPADLNDLINLDDDYLRLTTRAQMCASLAMSAVSGDATDWKGMAQLYYTQLDNLIATASGKRHATLKTVMWR